MPQSNPYYRDYEADVPLSTQPTPKRLPKLEFGGQGLPAQWPDPPGSGQHMKFTKPEYQSGLMLPDPIDSENIIRGSLQWPSPIRPMKELFPETGPLGMRDIHEPGLDWAGRPRHRVVWPP